ncbi:MAG: UDP-3-O-acyl-N-acetylglucosamine deacetylase [Rickettsiales bacterium]|jgi:UDP-3-O-[3-hydroxymyristoyl] N-acetylglucosamine deacetylase|nr:UDP-3-O-acyl-N-acetylglucosamine deacetylase [Rickettsiales bacterium]
MAGVKNKVIINGVGIHSGKQTRMVINPAAKPGIFFKRVDIKGAPAIPAVWDNVSDATKMNTTIGAAPNQVQTIEHLMAALFITGIDRALIEIDGPETPIMDGSAAEFIKLIEKAGTTGPGDIKKLIVKKPVIAYRRDLIRRLPIMTRIFLAIHNMKMGRREDGYVALSPHPKGMLVQAVLDYPDKIIGRQNYTMEDPSDFVRDVAKARTFGRVSEWEYLKKRGLGQGANEKNVIALNADGTGTLNKLHYKDEFVRHKIVDLIGDMYMSGYEVVGKIESVKGSHGLNNEVLRILFSDPSNYEIMG